MKALAASISALLLFGCAASSEDVAGSVQEIRDSVSSNEADTIEQAKVVRDAFLATTSGSLSEVPLEACPPAAQEMVRAETDAALLTPSIFIVAAGFMARTGKIYVVELRHAVFGPDGLFREYNRGLVFYDESGRRRLSALGNEDTPYRQLAWRAWSADLSWSL